MKETIKQKAVFGLEKRLGTICYIKRDNVEIPYTDGFTDGYQECEKDLQDLKTELDVMKAADISYAITEELKEAKRIMAIGLKAVRTSNGACMSAYEKLAEKFLQE